MTTPYRNETEALRERKAALEQETNRLKEQRAQLEWMSARESEIAKELAAIDETLASGAKRRLPTLDQVSVASPCSANWNEMLGDERVRFCLSCEKHVYDISAMPKAEAEALIAAQAEAAGELCIRFYRREDGTIMTSDCPVGVTRKRRKKLALGVAGAGALAFGAFAALQRAADDRVMGKIEAVYVEPPPQQLQPPELDVHPVTTEEPPARPDRYVAGRMLIAPKPKPAPVHPQPKTR
ncbi:MAG: hypothetical protein KIT84_10400 [Labilithrix sp.]|nr:hypothetical protein [Labilithrix sp.]MCW5811415.1 hypothetical protein [Labilithrix sp.]